MHQTTADQARPSASGPAGLPPTLRVVAILGRIPQIESVPADRRLLLTAEAAPDSALPPLARWAVYRLPAAAPLAPCARRPPAAAPEPLAPLPFADNAFTVICVYGALRQVVQQPRLLSKVRRMLDAGGRAVVIEPLASFNFTTFPIGGPAQLLRRQLLQAGFQRVHALPDTEQLLVFLAHRDAAVAPTPEALAVHV